MKLTDKYTNNKDSQDKIILEDSDFALVEALENLATEIKLLRLKK